MAPGCRATAADCDGSLHSTPSHNADADLWAVSGAKTLYPKRTSATIAIVAGMAFRSGLLASTALVAAAHNFKLAPLSNASDPHMAEKARGGLRGCGQTVYWPGTTFQNGVWSYADFDCTDYWAYDYVVNVTARPQGLGYNPATGFAQSTVTISNTGSCAGFDYTVTIISTILNDKATVCNGVLEAGDNPVQCNIVTVPGQWFGVNVGFYYVDINIHNRNWVCSAEGNIQIGQGCTGGGDAGADLCSSGTIYGFLDTNLSPAILGYATGGCISSLASSTGCNGNGYCCPDGQQPGAVTSCGSGDGSYDSPCYNCTGGC